MFCAKASKSAKVCTFCAQESKSVVLHVLCQSFWKCVDADHHPLLWKSVATDCESEVSEVKRSESESEKVMLFCPSFFLKLIYVLRGTLT